MIKELLAQWAEDVTGRWLGGEIHLQSRREGKVGRREGGDGLLALVSPSTNLPLDVIFLQGQHHKAILWLHKMSWSFISTFSWRAFITFEGFQSSVLSIIWVVHEKSSISFCRIWTEYGNENHCHALSASNEREMMIRTRLFSVRFN